MEKKSKNLKNLDQLRKEKGKTHWATLITEEKEQPKKSIKKTPKK